MGKQSTKFVKTQIKPDDIVQLETDAQIRNGKRILAYVYLANGAMLNQLLVEEGFAQVATYPPNVKYVDKFIEAEKSARENKKGLWKEYLKGGL